MYKYKVMSTIMPDNTNIKDTEGEKEIDEVKVPLAPIFAEFNSGFSV